MDSMKTLVFTGGHHTGALEAAKMLKGKGWNIVWFGHRHAAWGDKSDSAEYREVTAGGIKFYNLLAGKFHKTYNPIKLIRIPWGFLQASYLLFKIKPAGIVSFGGYLAVPTVIMGWLLGIPGLTHEQTVTQGWANKLISKFVKKVAVTWPENLKDYGVKGILMGLPLRKEILEAKKSKLKRPLLFITGGKQGAHVINEAVFSALPHLDFEILHQTGNNSEYKDFAKAKMIKSANYKCVEYLNAGDQIQALVDAEVVISRSGAHITYELGYLGKKCVLIPIPWVSHNEQYKNAQILENAGMAVILNQNQLTSENLLLAINQAQKLKPKSLDLITDASQRMVNLCEEYFG